MDIDFEAELSEAATQFHDAIVEKIDSSMGPPNALSTIKRKGHDHTLIDTETMRNTLAVTVEAGDDGLTAKVGWPDPDVETYAAWNNDGTKTIPARPFVDEAIDENEDRISSIFEQQIAKKIDSFFD